MTLDFLRLLNSPVDGHELMRAVVHFFRNWSECEAVGIRLREGDDFPYYETTGFPEDFVLAENHLCAVDQKGEMLRDGQGDPVLECLCGNILCGRFDPSKPFFTNYGSFWCNNTTAFFAAMSAADRQANIRGRCYREGYESARPDSAPAGSEIIGLLQLNDHRRDRFTPETIALVKGFPAVWRRPSSCDWRKRRCREHERRHRAILDAVRDDVWLKDAEGRYLAVNVAFCRFAGKEEQKVLGKTDRDVFPAEIADMFQAVDREVMRQAVRICRKESIGGRPRGRRVVRKDQDSAGRRARSGCRNGGHCPRHYPTQDD